MAKYGSFRYGTVKYGSDTPYIFDRNSLDILNNTDKCYVNYTDLNRIETRMKELSNMLNDEAYVNTIISKTNWIKQIGTNDLSNFPLFTQLKRLHDNEEKLISAFYTHPTTPKLPDTLENLTIYGLNDVVKILYDLYVLVLSMKKSFNYCGDYICEE